MINIGYEDLVANALIEIEEYGRTIISKLKEAQIGVHRSGSLAQLKQEYSDYFYVHEDINGSHIFAKSDILLETCGKNLEIIYL